MKPISLVLATAAMSMGLFCFPGRAVGQVDWADLFQDRAPASTAAKPAKPAPQPPAAGPRAVRAQAPAPAPRPQVAAPKPPARPAPVAAVRQAAPPKPAPRPTLAAARAVPQPAAPPVAPDAVAPPVVPEPVAPPPAVPAGIVLARRDNGGPPGIRLADLGLQEGDVIDASNVDRYAAYLSPGMQWAIKYGWRLTVTEPVPTPMLQAYREATEKYSGQVSLGPDGLTLQNYVAGRPFPDIDPNDPQAALKIMWNFSYGWAYTDDFDVRLFDADTGSVGPNRSMTVDRHYIIEHLRRLYYNGRLYVEPKPVFPNNEGYRYKESLHPILEPFDLKGVGFVAYRYIDPQRQDDTWLYLPQIRRVRRMSSAQRSDALFGQDSDLDSYNGYNGHIAWNEYKLLGETVTLATLHARNFPVKWQEPADFLYDDVWEPREVWVVEARSKLPQYAYGKRVIFMDKEAYVIPYSDIYERGGQLWKIWVNQYGFRKEAMPGGRRAVYSEDMAFNNAIMMLDIQLAHATRAALPSTKGIGEEGFYINLGERSGTSEEFFTIAHMVESGH